MLDTVSQLWDDARERHILSQEIIFTVLVLVVASFFALYNVYRMASDFEQMTEVTSDSVVLAELAAQIKESEANHSLYIKTADKQYLENYEFLNNISDSTLAVLAQRMDDAAQKGRLGNLKRGLVKMRAEMLRMNSVLRASGYVAGLDIRATEDLLLTRSKVHNLLEQLGNFVSSEIERKGVNTRQRLGSAVTAIYVMIFSVLFFSMGVFYYIRRESLGRHVVAEERSAVIRGMKMKIQDLESETQRLEDVIESARVAVLSLSDAGNILYANRHAEELTGYSVTSLLGEHVSTLLELHAQSRYSNYFKQFVAMDEEEQKLKSTREMLAEKEGGGVFPMEIDITPTRIGRYRYVAVLRDISKQKDMEIEIQKMRQSKEIRSDKEKTTSLEKDSHVKRLN